MNVKHTSYFLVCVLLAAAVWLLHNLSKEYDAFFRYEVAVESNLRGHAAEAEADDLLLLKGRASGFYILRHSLRPQTRHLHLQIDAARLQEGRGGAGAFYFLPQKEQALINSALTASVTLEAVYTDTLHFLFPVTAYKKVPVVLDASITFASQYEAFRPVKLLPDSVEIYGPQARLQQVQEVKTRPLDLGNLRRPAEGFVSLVPEEDLRFSHKEVKYEVDVRRYVTLTRKVSPRPVNVPPGHELLLLPREVELSVRLPFDRPEAVMEDFRLEVVIDYLDFTRSVSGKIAPRLLQLPPEASQPVLDPPYIDCILQKSGL